MPMDSRSRLRGSFADVLQRQAAELGQLARDSLRDPDIKDALVFELERIRGTALSLGIDAVDRATRQAMDAVGGGGMIDAVEHLVDVCRQLEGLEPAFRPVVLLGQAPPEADEHAAVLKVVTDMPAFLQAVKVEDPCALVVPIAELESVKTQLEGRARAIPLFAVGPRHDLDQRILASRIGAQAYLSEPIDIDRVVSRVRARTGDTDPPPFRVLLVESDEKAGEAAIKALEGPDRIVRWVRDAAQLLEQAEALCPELIVMATSVGSHSGIELSEVCRGHELMADVPTLFVATQDDVEQTGFLISADDTLIKPVPPSVLRARATSRLERFRHTLKSNQIDRLTGCLGRAALLRAADREVGLARRSGNPLSVVLIDIDGMHAVNEKHGLVGGDRVLRALAEVLSFNLRETDLVGRAGGDAFGALLPKCGVLDARKRIENVRRKYQAWFAQQGMDPVEFSAGIADTSDGFRDVLARADRALIEARHAGGSRSSLGR